MNQQELKEKLEELIDKSSIRIILETMSDIALEKSQHIAENWQDQALATKWAKASRRLQRFSEDDWIAKL